MLLQKVSRRVFTKFKETFLKELEKHAPIKKKIVRDDQVPYMTKPLRKAIVTRSGPQNKLHKLKTKKALQKFNKQDSR